MPNKQTGSVLIPILITVIVAAIVVFGYAIYKKSDKIKTRLSTDKQEAPLEDENASDLSHYRTIQLMGQRKDPALLDQVEKYRISSQPVLRRAIAEAIGRYDDSRVNGWLGDFLKDVDVEVRLSAIQSLGRLRQNERVNILSMYGQNPEITKKELVEISASLIRIGSKLIKNSNVEKLIALSQKENDSDVQSLALMRLFATVPSDKRVILALQKIIDNNQSPQLMGMSISHLAALRSPWLSERLDKYSRHQKDLVRLASISAIHFVCPKDHWNLLKGRLASETNPGILKAILHESSFIGGPKARDFLDGVINEKKLGNDYVVIAKVELEKLSQDSISHCR